MSQREAISPTLRFEVLRRCNFSCYYCGVPASLGLKVLHVDHVIPVSLGGTNDPWNLVAACWDCNAGKSNGVPTDEFIRQVRNEFCAYMESRGREIVSCRYCAIPFQLEEEDDRCVEMECDLCNALIFYGYDNGQGRQTKWVAP